ncbi:MAG TPA: hypothetical protein VFC78_00430 [Tepidisphaeraceae bacterium]|nr:hypothetical protein [Tepidisphaeraceae bacterium]
MKEKKIPTGGAAEVFDELMKIPPGDQLVRTPRVALWSAYHWCQKKLIGYLVTEPGELDRPIAYLESSQFDSSHLSMRALAVLIIANPSLLDHLDVFRLKAPELVLDLRQYRPGYVWPVCPILYALRLVPDCALYGVTKSLVQRSMPTCSRLLAHFAAAEGLVLKPRPALQPPRKRRARPAASTSLSLSRKSTRPKNGDAARSNANRPNGKAANHKAA